MSKKTIPITLNLVVDKSCKRVVFAESNGHFVDILLSFLTLPLGTILQLSKKSFGSMHNLLQSVEKLRSDCFRSETCRSMLLQPLNTAAELFSALPINYASSCQLFSIGYVCNASFCFINQLSFYANAVCPCRKPMDRKLRFVPLAASSSSEAFIFLRGSFEYIISDDLLIFQSSTEATVELLNKNGIKQRSCLQTIRAEVTAEKIIELLKQLLVSDTPLSDVFIGGQNNKDKLRIIRQPSHKNYKEIAGQTSPKKISIKLFVRKVGKKVLYAEASEEFANQLVSFLTYPMGSVVNKLGGESYIRCIDILYKSIESLKLANCFKVHRMIEALQNPMLPPYFSLKNKLINVDEQPAIERYYYMCGKACHSPTEFMTVPNFKCKYCCDSVTKQLTLANSLREYVRSSRYMILDDLIVKKLSSVTLATEFLKEDLKEIEVKSVEIGEHEALILLQNSISSKKVFTNALLTNEDKLPKYFYLFAFVGLCCMILSFFTNLIYKSDIVHF